MTIRECFYLEYVCAAATAVSFWAWLFCLSFLKHHRARRQGGPLLFVVNHPISHLAPAATALCTILLLAAWSGFFLSRRSGTFVHPFAVFITCILGLIPVFYWRRSQVAVELREHGMVSHQFRERFLPWEDVSYGQWIERHNYIEVFARRRRTTIAFRCEDAAQFIAIAGQFVEIRNEAFEIIHAGSNNYATRERRSFTAFQAGPRRPFQFSILSLLFLTTVVAAASGWYGVTQESYRLRRQVLDPLHQFLPDYPDDGPIDCLLFNGTPQPVTDRDMDLLKPFGDLNILGFYDCPLTDAAIPDLVSMKSLKTLIIRNSSITPAGFKRLKKEMPHTEVYH